MSGSTVESQVHIESKAYSREQGLWVGKKCDGLDVRTFWMTPKQRKVEKTLRMYPRNHGLNAPMEVNNILKFLLSKN